MWIGCCTRIIGLNNLAGDRCAERLASIARLAIRQQRPEKRQAQFMQIGGELLGVNKLLPQS